MSELFDKAVRIVRELDRRAVEPARDWVGQVDLTALLPVYWTLTDWPSRLIFVDLVHDQSHPALDEIMRDVLRAPPGEGDDVDFPKIFALLYLYEEYDFGSFYNDRELLHRTVNDVLARLGRTLDTALSAASASPGAAGGAEVEIVKAVKAGWLPDVERLLREGVSPDQLADGIPILTLALLRNQPAVAMALLAAGSDPNLARLPSGQTPLRVAASIGNSEVLDELLRRGAAPDVADINGTTPLMAAARSGQTRAVRTLLDLGANPLQRMTDGRTAILMATHGGRSEILELLIEAGAQPDGRQPEYTPLAAAALEGSTSMVRLLLGYGVDPNTPAYPELGPAGWTPLMYAAAGGQLEMVRLLLDAGADRTHTAADGRTATDVTAGRRAESVRELLATG